MSIKYSPPPYPLHAFHMFVKNAALEVQRNVQAPDALIGMSFLNGMTISCQGLIDVRLPTGKVRPTVMNSAQVGESGERKSEVDGFVLQPIHALDEARAKKFDTDLSVYMIAKHLWKLNESALNAQYKTAVRNEEPTDNIECRLEKHMATEPIRPRRRRFLRNDVTERALMDALEGDGESILVTADEGHIVLGSGMISRVGFRNAEWGGVNLGIDRAGGESVIARNPRISIALILQPAILKAYLDEHGDILRGSGNWSRYLFGWPASTQGSRFVSYVPVWEHLSVFHARMTELLEEYDRKIDSGSVERTIVEFSDEAVARWFEMVNVTESMLQPWGYLNDIKDFASKAMEIVARVAAILHHFTRQEGRINVDTLQRALDIVEWHLHEFKRIFAPQFDVPLVQLDAQAVEDYLYTHFFSKGISAAPRNAVLRNGPVRPAARLQDALDFLAVQQKIWIGVGANRRRYINPGPNWGRN